MNVDPLLFVDNETYEQRITICRACQYFKPKCNKCGFKCNMLNNKLNKLLRKNPARVDAICPEQKW